MLPENLRCENVSKTERHSYPVNVRCIIREAHATWAWRGGGDDDEEEFLKQALTFPSVRNFHAHFDAWNARSHSNLTVGCISVKFCWHFSV